jgi:hypothetical protein
MKLREESVPNLDRFDEGARFFLHNRINLACINEGLQNLHEFFNSKEIPQLLKSIYKERADAENTYSISGVPLKN